MDLKNAHDLFALSRGDKVTKRNLFDLIQYSKVSSSTYWSGADMSIGNTPQQGINWVGNLPQCRAVIIKTRPGSYEHDGWSNNRKSTYHYSFKAKEGKVSYSEKANRVLIEQPQYLYPILLFTENMSEWLFEGSFSVSEINAEYVALNRGIASAYTQEILPGETPYREGGRRYVTHLMAERSTGIVKALKSQADWSCDICDVDFREKYGVPYIEAHHKTPISTFSSDYTVTLSDLALLCPNCHRAVHIYMKMFGLEYQQIREKLRSVEIV